MFFGSRCYAFWWNCVSLAAVFPSLAELLFRVFFLFWAHGYVSFCRWSDVIEQSRRRLIREGLTCRVSRGGRNATNNAQSPLYVEKKKVLAGLSLSVDFYDCIEQPKVNANVWNVTSVLNKLCHSYVGVFTFGVEAYACFDISLMRAHKRYM